jgi:hypothetical protein
MAIGIEVSKAVVDSVVGSTARSFFAIAQQVKQVKLWLDSVTDQELKAAPYGYSDNEVAVLRSAVGDLATAVAVFEGAQALPAPTDLRAFAKRLIGINY